MRLGRQSCLRQSLCLCCVIVLILVLVMQAMLWKRHPAKKEPFDRFVVPLQLRNAAPLISVHVKNQSVKCETPLLDPFEKTLMEYFTKIPPLKCGDELEWVSVKRGAVHVSEEAQLKYDNVSCDHMPLLRADDSAVKNGPSRPLRATKPLVLNSDFFRVSCLASDGTKHESIHASVQWRPEIHTRLADYAARFNKMPTDTRLHDERPPERPEESHNPSRQPLSVFMLGLDSLSRMAWQRYLPRTRTYLVNHLGGIELEGYNIVGDGTPSALLPILTGKMEEELPEARRGFPGAKHIDAHPWIWNRFAENGYVTAWAEDCPSIATFNYRMLGFQNPPTDHYMRPFYVAAQKEFRRYEPYCLGPTPRHVVLMNWFRDLFETYRAEPKFFFAFASEMSHNDNNRAQLADEDIVAFLQGLEKSGHLNSTLLILMSDHGARHGHIRATAQGKLEERMPFFLLRFPPWVLRKYPGIKDSLDANRHRLSTPFDIYQTFLNILNYSDHERTADHKTHQRGLSLLQTIPEKRQCSDAEVTPHWCACLQWKRVNSSHPLIAEAVRVMIVGINKKTQQYRDQCAELSLSKIHSSSGYSCRSEDGWAQSKINRYWNRYNGASGRYDGVECRESMEMYQLVFTTYPGDAKFELVFSFDRLAGYFYVSEKEISRINTYGSQPACIAETAPHLRPYCYCTSR